MSNCSNALEIPEHAPIAIDMRFKDLPIVDARLARSTGVSQHKSRFDLVGHYRNGFTINSVRIEMNGAHAAIERGVVVLAASRHLNNLSFYVLRDHAHLFEREVPVGKTGERRSCCNH